MPNLIKLLPTAKYVATLIKSPRLSIFRPLKKFFLKNKLGDIFLLRVREIPTSNKKSPAVALASIASRPDFGSNIEKK